MRLGCNQKRPVTGLHRLVGRAAGFDVRSVSPRVPVVIVVGGLPEDSQIIGPFATPALATRFARRQCHGDYTIAPLHR
jgi:hypothetical protein